MANFRKIAAAIIAACTLAGPISVMAEQSTSGDSNYSSGAAGTITETSGAKINVTYDTSAGTWKDGYEGASHAAGTYQVRIPASIAWQNMGIGSVPSGTAASYSVRVVGSIPSGKTVTVKASASPTLTCGDDSSVTQTLKQGKTSWSSDEAYGTANATGLLGTAGTDTITLGGAAKRAGAYTGTIVYTASLN